MLSKKFPQNWNKCKKEVAYTRRLIQELAHVIMSNDNVIKIQIVHWLEEKEYIYFSLVRFYIKYGIFIFSLTYDKCLLQQEVNVIWW